MPNLKTLGAGTYRLTYEGNDASLNEIIATAQRFRADGTGKKLYVTLDVSTVDINTGVTFTTEALARAYGLATATYVATALASYSDVVVGLECGNEMTRKDSLMPNSVVMGTNASDFDNTKWKIFRGVMAGCLQGVLQNCTIMPFSCAWTFAEIAAPQMLWDGTNPDGTSGGELVRFPGYGVHSYHAWNYPYAAPDSNHSGWIPFFNYIEQFKIRFNGPYIVISEANGDADSQADPDMAAWNWRVLVDTYNSRFDLNILGYIYYAMFDADYKWGCVDSSGLLISTRGQSLRQFIVSHPDVDPLSLEMRALNILGKFPAANIRYYRASNSFSNAVATGTPSNGGQVPLWPDVFQNTGAAGVQGTSPPVFASGAQPALTFNGNGYSMSAPFNLVGDDFAVIVGAAPTGTANPIASSRAAVALSATNASSHYGRIGAIMYSTSGITAEWYGDTGGDFQATYNPGTYAAANVATSRKVGNTGSLRVNGAQRATVDLTSFTSSFVPSAGWIGAQYANDTAGFIGNIYVVIAVKGSISDADLLVLEQWANSFTPTGVSF